MLKRILGHNNPNKDIMVVEQQEGGTDDDHYFGSIGDAVAQHVQNLNPAERQMWEDLLHLDKSGGIFRVVDSWEYTDNDPFNLRGKDTVELLKEKLTSQPELLNDQKFLTAYQEAVEVEMERREGSEDALDRGELIPYDEWIENPQQWKDRDIPKTPPTKLIYMGNTSRSFYDSFPEFHPHSSIIDKTLELLNIAEEEEFNEWRYNKICGTINAYLIANPDAKQTCEVLGHLVADICLNENIKVEQEIKKSLLLLDQQWSQEYLAQAKQKALEDPVTKLFAHNYKQWKNSTNKNDTYASIKAFGVSLFSDPELKPYIKNYHWAMYRRIKKQFAPVVLMRGIDINRARVKEIQANLRCSRSNALDIWHNRPFDNAVDLYRKQLVQKEAFCDSEHTSKIVDWIEANALLDIQNKQVRYMNSVKNKLMQEQEKDNKLTEMQWQMIWNYYRIMKSELTQSMQQVQA
jgi:hypothetical protein